MKNILIINLKRLGDIYQGLHLVNSIYKSSPESKIYYLIFEEFKQVADCFPNIQKTFTIPRKKIITFYKNPIYSMGLGINELEKSLRPIIDHSWDNIINFSKDLTSTYITSYISKSTSSHFSGIRFSDKQTIEYSNFWANLYNDVLSSDFPSPFNAIDTIHLQSNLVFSYEKSKVQTNIQYDEIVINNFNILKSSNKSLKKILGFQITSSKKEKEIPFKIITQLLQMYLDTSDLLPIILIAPNDEERSMANKINQVLSKKIINIEADLTALPSVIKELDIVITPDTLVKHVCDIVGTPCLEISLGPAPLFLQGTSNPKSRILSYRTDKRHFSYKNNSDDFLDRKLLSPQDIFQCSKLVLGDLDKNSIFDQKTQWSLYSPIKDEFGTFLVNESGFINPDFELRRVFSRQIILKISKKTPSEKILEYIINNFNEDVIKSWIKNEKAGVINLTKSILSVLRFLIQAQENETKSSLFIKSLGHLLDHCYDNKLATVLVLIFRGQLETISTGPKKNNFKEVENIIYKLKNYAQITMICLEELETMVAHKKQIYKANASKTSIAKAHTQEHIF